MRWGMLGLMVVVFGACNGEGDDKEAPTDLDGDGFDETVDCDDDNAEIHPEAQEICDADQTDEDCDEVADDDDDSVDPNTLTEWFLDADGDGFGDITATAILRCDDPSSAELTYLTDHTDCDDSRADVNPGASEIVGDGLDSDCDGGEICFADVDNDSYVDDSGATVVSVDADCDDDSEGGETDLTGDCEDDDPAINPGAVEVCDPDDVDENCNEQADDADTGTEDSTKTDYFVDGDQDEFGAGASQRFCDDPSTTDDWFSLSSSDCDDAVATTYPGATEGVGDGVDSDCDGGEICFADADNDHYVDDTGATVVSADPDCTDDGEGSDLTLTGDCDDSNKEVNPGALEVCDGADVDENCNGRADDADATTVLSTKTRYYSDADKDNFGDMDDTGTLYCDDPSTTAIWLTIEHTDCDDDEATTYPGATEFVGDSVDSDCDGGELCYVDLDDDGYVDRSKPNLVSVDSDCLDGGEGTASDPVGDCDDSQAAINPSATEVCDGIDNDCDSTTTEDGSSMIRYTSSTGARVDNPISASTWATYTATSPWESIPIWDDLELTFCKGTFPMNWRLGYDTVVKSQSGVAAEVILSGGSTDKSVFMIYSSSNTVSFQDVTISDGDGVNGFQTFMKSGGGVYCYSSGRTASLTFDNVVLKDNTAAGTLGSGAAVSADGCALTLKNSTIEGNTAIYGAVAAGDAALVLDNVTFKDNSGELVSGLYLVSDKVNTTATLTDVQFLDNALTSTSKALGAMYTSGYNTSLIYTVNMEDVWFDGNTSAMLPSAIGTEPVSTGLFVTSYSEVSWDGVTAANVGSTDNDFNGIGVWGADANLSVDNIDMGLTGGVSDNELHDVMTNDSTYRAGNNVTFVCNDEACSTDSRVPDGDSTNDQYQCELGSATYDSTGDDRFRGNIFLADRDSTIESFEAYFSADRYCDFDYYMLERPGTTGAWTVMYARVNQTRTSFGANWQHSGHIGVPVTSGRYYALLTAWNCPITGDTVTYYYYPTTDTNAGFGEYVSSMFAFYSNGTAYATGSSYTISSATSTARYRMRVNLNDLETTSSATCIP